jgi:hypothetical protein
MRNAGEKEANQTSRVLIVSCQFGLFRNSDQTLEVKVAKIWGGTEMFRGRISGNPIAQV